MSRKDRKQIGPVFLDRVTMDEAIQQIILWAQVPQLQVKRVATVNAQFVDIASKDQQFAALLNTSDLVVADGMSLIFASRLMKRQLPERIAGIDLMVRLCEEAARRNLSVYLLGGGIGAAEKAAAKLRARFFGLRIAGTDCPSPGFEKCHGDSSAVAERIVACVPDLLFVGFGAPKQEQWIAEHRALPAKVAMGVGCSFDVLAGDLRRAPNWMQCAGLEWLFRLCQEPGRLWRRYLIGNLQFGWTIFFPGEKK